MGAASVAVFPTLARCSLLRLPLRSRRDFLVPVGEPCPNTVGAQHVAESNHALKYTHVGAAHDWQNVEPRGTHALKRQVRRLVGVDMRERVVTTLSAPPVLRLLLPSPARKTESREGPL